MPHQQEPERIKYRCFMLPVCRGSSGVGQQLAVRGEGGVHRLSADTVYFGDFLQREMLLEAQLKGAGHVDSAVRAAPKLFLASHALTI